MVSQRESLGRQRPGARLIGAEPRSCAALRVGRTHREATHPPALLNCAVCGELDRRPANRCRRRGDRIGCWSPTPPLPATPPRVRSRTRSRRQRRCWPTWATWHWPSSAPTTTPSPVALTGCRTSGPPTTPRQCYSRRSCSGAARKALQRLRDSGLLRQHGDRGGATYTLVENLAPPVAFRLSPDQISDLLIAGAAEEPLTNQRVRDMTGLNREQARSLLRRLVQDGRLRQEGSRRGTAYLPAAPH